MSETQVQQPVEVETVDPDFVRPNDIIHDDVKDRGYEITLISSSKEKIKTSLDKMKWSSKFIAEVLEQQEKNYAEEFKGTNPVFFPPVEVQLFEYSSEILNLIIKYATNHFAIQARQIPKPNFDDSLDKLIHDNDKLFLQNIKEEHLKDLFNACTYLSIEDLFELLCAHVAILTKGMTAQQIRDFSTNKLGIKVEHDFNHTDNWKFVIEGNELKFLNEAEWDALKEDNEWEITEYTDDKDIPALAEIVKRRKEWLDEWLIKEDKNGKLYFEKMETKRDSMTEKQLKEFQARPDWRLYRKVESVNGDDKEIWVMQKGAKVRKPKTEPETKPEKKEGEKEESDSDSDDDDQPPTKFRVKKMDKPYLKLKDAEDEYDREIVVMNKDILVGDEEDITDDNEDNEENADNKKEFFDNEGNPLPVDFGKDIWQITEIDDEEEEFKIERDSKGVWQMVKLTEDESRLRAGYLNYWLITDKQTGEFKPIKYTKFVKKPEKKPVPTVQPVVQPAQITAQPTTTASVSNDDGNDDSSN